jgi:hypothetical protein
MKKFYLSGIAFLVIIFSLVLPKIAFSQTCATVTATYVITESRCAATGTVQINASGGSGNYQYKATGPVNTNYTSSSLITGLSAGRYLITIKDATTNCVYATDSVTVPGDYQAPTFFMVSTDVTCINGNDGTITVTGQSSGRAPFSYQIIVPSASGVGTVSSAGVFTGLISGDYYIQLSDSCGAIQTRSAVILNYDWYIKNYSVTKIGCDSISVTINLKDSKGNETPNPIFNGFSYGASVNAGDTTWFTTNTFHYYIGNKHTVKLFVKDICGNIKSVVWTDNFVPNVDATVLITNRACSTFTATVTGQVNLTTPSYCIYDNNNTLLSCNITGVFPLLPYGSYCIRITDNCYDTTITRCFTVAPPIPFVDVKVKIDPNCKNFTATVTGQTNLNNPNYCLYDAFNVLMYCNTTGVFPNLPYGSYCIRIFNDPACYDTTITRCFTVTRPVPSAGLNVIITNRTCSTFTAIIGDTANLNNPQFCLYDAAHVLIICNSTGIFDSLPYGTYCIDIINNPSCYDTTISRCFTVYPSIPSVAANVSLSNKTCTDFTATITGQTNLNNPKYCIYNNLNVLLICNATGVFTNLSYGSYCIRIQNNPGCYDTLISRCFSVLAPVTNINLTAKKSCSTIGTSDIKVSINSGIAAYSISLFSPTGTLMQSVTTSSNNYTFAGLSGLPSPQKYKVVVVDQCGNKDSVEIAPVISIVSRVISITPRCPSGIWPNGSADVLVNITNNNIGGDIKPKIIKKNGVAVSINPSSTSGYIFTFLNLGPATYIFDTYIEDCSKHLYDTVVVRPYIYPVLSGSNAYQCDNNGFSIGVNVAGGIAPYMYEIIGSVPASPSIITPPQASPVFTFNNGTTYSLIRLRAVDGCGNAGLYDVSVLPLANFIVTSDSLECINYRLTLRVDSIANAVYTWYKRIIPNDSIIVGTGPSYTIPILLPSDTGRYFCKIVVNNGCLVRFANYVVTGFCGAILPVDYVLSGTKTAEGNKLFWSAGASGTKTYELQKAVNNISDFKTIGSIDNTGVVSYSYIDKNRDAGNTYYRLKIISGNSMVKYSNIVLIKDSQFGINVYPNPVHNMLYIALKGGLPGSYLVELNTMQGQKIMSRMYSNIQNHIIEYPRDPAISNGIYILVITDLQNNQKQNIKIIYK